MLVGLLCVQRSFGGEASISGNGLLARLGAVVTVNEKRSDLQDQVV